MQSIFKRGSPIKMIYKIYILLLNLNLPNLVWCYTLQFDIGLNERDLHARSHGYKKARMRYEVVQSSVFFFFFFFFFFFVVVVVVLVCFVFFCVCGVVFFLGGGGGVLFCFVLFFSSG